ncbi:MAG: hypothetical protein K2H20_00675, partial [Bacilli bacterium]|nr:hypothetical protein [Bacilli bacterium]
WCIPIVSLDKIYLSIDSKNILFLDCTRLDGSKELVSRNSANTFDSVILQIKKISDYLLNRGVRNIILADDVVFSGSVLRKVISLFNQYNIRVVGIRSAISTFSSFKTFNDSLPLGLKCGYLLDEKVIDQICERDFYFGIAQSGISIVDNDKKIYKAPYFIPYGDPVKRASIPEKDQISFSKNCIARSIVLWEEIEKLSKKRIYIKDLPEKIIGTSENEEVVKVLKKEWRKL